jgi:hypothetical protein
MRGSTAAGMRGVGIQSQRDPELGIARREAEPVRHHAHDLARASVHVQRVSEHVAIPAKARAPQGFRYEDCFGTVRQVLFRREIAAQQRRDAQHRYQRRRDVSGTDTLWLRPPAGVRDVDRGILIDADAVDRPGQLLICEVGGRRLVRSR